MLKAMGASTFSLASWPPSEILSDAEPPHLAKAMKELRSPGKVVNREKFEAAPGAGGLAIAPCVDVKFVVPYVFAQGNRIAPFLPRDEIIDG